MSDKIEKFLAKLSVDDFTRIRYIISQIVAGDTDRLHVKAIVGRRDTYRVRSGRIRVIYKRQADGTASIIFIGNRDERTYRNL